MLSIYVAFDGIEIKNEFVGIFQQSAPGISLQPVFQLMRSLGQRSDI